MKGFSEVITVFIGMAVAVILIASVLLPEIFGLGSVVCAKYNQTGYGAVCIRNATLDAGTTALWSILPIILIAVLIIYLAV